MLEIIGEMSGKVFVFVSSVNRSPNMLEKLARRHIMPIMRFLVFVFHNRNRALFAQIGENLLK